MAAASDVERSIVLLGPPGAGKGTQAVDLATWRGLRHVSTGDLLRRAIAAGTPLGLRVKPILAAGGLVDDETVAGLVGEHLDRDGDAALLLDGFPRNIVQAKQLARLLDERGLPAPLVIELRVDDDVVVGRLALRRICPRCGPRPAAEEACGSCCAPVVSRPDDAESIVRERLRVYHSETAPLTEYFDALGLLRRVDGTATPDVVQRRIREAVEST